jgi:leader peptidase (prepilin peptidase) / N-methyltransferase
MQPYISNIIIFLGLALTGAAIGAASLQLSRLLMRQRGLADQISQKAQIILCLVLAAVFAIGYLMIGINAAYVYLMCIAALTLMISLIDIRHRVIPNQLILAIFGITALFALTGWLDFDWLSSLAGLGVCLVVFLLPALRGTKIGLGDVKLATAIGFAAGLTGSLLTIIIMGVLILIATIYRYNSAAFALKSMIPMGPFIMMAFMVIKTLTYVYPLSFSI